MRSDGFNAAMGSWYTMAIRLPRIRSSCRPRFCTMSSPQNRIRPPVTRAFLATWFMIANARVLLPQPDSPTSPMASPGRISNETSLTALTGPRRVA